MPENNRKLKITYHAYERAKQFGISPKQLVWLFWNSEKEPSPPGKRKDNKFASTTRYWRNGTVVMVAGEAEHKEHGYPIYLLLTVYDQKIDLPIKSLGFLYK